ncbi:MAG: hypothetical protein GY775_19375 [Candidatus Scalindua sp.]|nr:hypothetical protein [Candidatus Scalindua sp.]
MAKTSAQVFTSSEFESKSVSLPNQRVSRKKKNSKTWQHNTANYYINNRTNTYGNRKSASHIRANWDFYNSSLSPEEVQNELDPLGVDKEISSGESKLNFKFYNILDQPFDTLFGEELKRQSEVRAYAVNPGVINEKDMAFKAEVKKYLSELAQSQDPVDEESVKEKLKEFDRFKKNDLQSAHEKMVNNIIQVLINDTRLNLKMEYNNGFKNLEIAGEEIYRVGHTGKELSFNKVNSEKFWVYGLGYSPYVHDGYAWVEEDSLSAFKIIEEFSEYLSDKEIDDVLHLSQGDSDSMRPHKIGLVDVNNPDSPYATQALPLTYDKKFLTIDGEDDEFIDADGNIRVYRVQWLALRKLGKLKFYDEFGDVQYDWVDEEYKADESQGEEVEWLWVNELWEGVRIGEDIFTKVRPCPVQMRSQLNPSIVKPSYIGYVLSNNGVAAESRIDRLRPYQEMYNIQANKLMKLWTEHIGKSIVIDVAKIPEQMDTTEWYLWLKRFNIAFEDSFAEGKKGHAKGMVAGQMQQNSKVLDLSLAEDINQAIQTLSWIEDRVNKISAVPEARQGAVSGREGLGVTQQAIVSSSHQTEGDFTVHDLIKSLSYEVMIEYLKVLWRDEKGVRQYVLDDLSNHMLDIDGALLNEAEYGIRITNSAQLQSTFNAMQQLAHAAMQTGTATLSDIARMYMATSPSQMRHELEEAEEKRIEQSNAQAKMAQETEQLKMQQAEKLSQLQHNQELEKIDREYQYKLQIEELKASYKSEEHSRDTNQNNIEDKVELEKEQIKADSDSNLLDKKLSHDEKIKRMDIESKEKMEKIKASKARKSE